MKKWYQSKTVWFNIATGLISAGTELLPLVDLLDADRQAQLRAALIGALVVGNLILRLVTDTKVTR